MIWFGLLSWVNLVGKDEYVELGWVSLVGQVDWVNLGCDISGFGWVSWIG